MFLITLSPEKHPMPNTLRLCLESQSPHNHQLSLDELKCTLMMGNRLIIKYTSEGQSLFVEQSLVGMAMKWHGVVMPDRTLHSPLKSRRNTLSQLLLTKMREGCMCFALLWKAILCKVWKFAQLTLCGLVMPTFSAYLLKTLYLLKTGGGAALCIQHQGLIPKFLEPFIINNYGSVFC